MSTTIQAESFAANNLVGERGSLSAAYDPTDVGTNDTLHLVSTAGYVVGDRIYVGILSRDGCEKGVISAVASDTALTLEDPLGLPHAQSEPVTGVLGELIHIYRAANVNGTPPDPSMASVLATRPINPEQTSTYYTDSSGSASWWYWVTYYNPATNAETAITDSTPVRGDDFGHYTSISAIRTEARLEGAYNLKDSTIDQQRRAAEAEVNLALANTYTTPFTKPIPPAVQTITLQLAAALLLSTIYNGSNPRFEQQLKEVRARLGMMAQARSITDDSGTAVPTGVTISSWPNATTEDAPVEEGGSHRAFRMGDRF